MGDRSYLEQSLLGWLGVPEVQTVTAGAAGQGQLWPPRPDCWDRHPGKGHGILEWLAWKGTE